MTDISEIRGQFAELQRKYSEYLPKVDPVLVHDVLLRQAENPGVAPIYMLEVFTKPGVDTERARDYIYSKTGMSPAIFDNGTHYATNQKVTLEMLKEISDSDDVIEITGDYTGSIGAYPVSHEHGHKEHPKMAPAGSGQVAQLEPHVEAVMPTPEERKASGEQYNYAIYTAAGIVGAIILAGAIISGGMLPNVNVQPPTGDVQGVLHGYVGGPGGLPAVGAAVVAAEQETGHTVNEFVSVDGNYVFDLPPGTYIIMVAYPDGTNKVVNDYVVESGASHELDFSY